MAAKARAGKLENTIEQCRNDGKWQKSIELAEELKSSSPVHGKIGNSWKSLNVDKIFTFVIRNRRNTGELSHRRGQA